MSPFEPVPSPPSPRRRRARTQAKGALIPWLAAQILGDLRESGAQPGSHITEQALADRFEVSRTPVRMALGLLAESGAVERRPNRGYFVAQAPAAVAESSVAPVEDDRLYYRIA